MLSLLLLPDIDNYPELKTRLLEPLLQRLSPLGQSHKMIGVLLQGGPGTGKSFVIKNTLHLAKAWGLEDAVLTMATTGAAGLQINGHTWQSQLGMNRSGSTTSKKRLTELAAVLDRVRLIIVDEHSMLGFEGLAELINQITKIGPTLTCYRSFYVVTDISSIQCRKLLSGSHKYVAKTSKHARAISCTTACSRSASSCPLICGRSLTLTTRI